MSNESEDEDIQCFLDVELETLRSIYVNELDVFCDEGRPTSVAIQLYPSTADNVDEQYVRMSLIVTLPAEYPDVIPDIQIKNPRGLSDEKLQRIKDDLFSKAEERKGGTMLFELIERAKDHLTAGNRPSCQCAICLYGFTEQDVFTKTKCYHYFHSHCLSRYITYQMKEVDAEKPIECSEVKETSREVFCPVCRIPITFFFQDVCSFPPPSSAKDDNFTVTEDLKQLQNQMADLYEKQKDKGGIIDVEAEKKKFLLEISSVPSKTEPVQEAERLSTVQRSTSEELHEEFSQRKKENDVAFSKYLKTSNSARNSTSRNNESTNRYQKYNQKGKDSNFAPRRSSQTRNNKGNHARKSDIVHEEGCQQYLAEEQRFAKSTSHVKDSVDDLEKSKVQKNDETSDINQASFDTYVEDGIYTVDDVNLEVCLESNIVEHIQNKHQHSGITGSRPVYHKRYHNYNRRNDFHKQRQYNDDSGRKHTFSEFQEPTFGINAGFSNRWSENYHQYARQSDNYHQQRNAGNYNQRFRNAENYHQLPGRRANYYENRLQKDFNCPPKQNDNCQQSRQDFHRRSRHHSRFEHRNPNEREQTLLCNSEWTDYGNAKVNHNKKSSPVKNSHSYLELKSVEKHEQNAKDDLVKVRKNKSLRKYCEGYKNADTKNSDSPTETNKPHHEHHRYQNKDEGKPRNRNNSYMKHQNSPDVLPGHGVSKNPDYSMLNKASATPDVYPMHPFRKPNGKMYSEACESDSSQNKKQTSVVKPHKICDISSVFDISSDCNNDVFSPALNSFTGNSPKETSNAVLTSTDVSNSVSRPPPGFTKKVVYGLPSVKPPPGFSQS